MEKPTTATTTTTTTVEMESAAVVSAQSAITSLLGKVAKLFKAKGLKWPQIAAAWNLTLKYCQDMEAIFKPLKK